MPRLSKDAKAAAEAQAAADAELLAKLQERDKDVPPAEPESAEDTEPTIADRFVGMANLLVQLRQSTRLGESTLSKLMEIALQYHAWDYQRRAQEQASMNQFSKFMTPPENGDAGDAGDETPALIPDEYIGEANTNVVPVDFTPAEES